jgi:site-specific DNA-methyltransferase (cytosine-N4-specific)
LELSEQAPEPYAFQLVTSNAIQAQGSTSVQPNHDYRGYRGISLHPYPATMPLPLARDLIVANSRRGGTIVDPFVGTGTVLRAAAALGHLAFGSDINPLAVLIARVAITPVDAGTQLREYERAITQVLQLGSVPRRWPPKAYHARLERWFAPEAMRQLARIAGAIYESTPTPDMLRFLELAFSRTVRAASLSRRGELKLWRSKDGSFEEPRHIFDREARDLLWRGILGQQHESPLLGRPQSQVLLEDAQALLRRASNVDLILTSPPYGDSWTTVAYGNFSMLSRMWLTAIDPGFGSEDPAHADANAVGGASHQRNGSAEHIPYLSRTLRKAYDAIHEKRSDRALELLHFVSDMQPILELMCQSLRRSGRLVLVIGPRKVAGVHVDTGDVFAELLGHYGLHRVDRHTRNVSGKRLPGKTKQGRGGLSETINAETIDVFKKA